MLISSVRVSRCLTGSSTPMEKYCACAPLPALMGDFGKFRTFPQKQLSVANVTVAIQAGRTHMNVRSSEPARKTYLKSGLFLGPGLLAWAFVAVFVLPKLKQIWRDADLIDHRISEFQWMIRSVSFAMDNLGMILLLAAAVLV